MADKVQACPTTLRYFPAHVHIPLLVLEHPASTLPHGGAGTHSGMEMKLAVLLTDPQTQIQKAPGTRDCSENSVTSTASSKSQLLSEPFIWMPSEGGPSFAFGIALGVYLGGGGWRIAENWVGRVLKS